MILSLPGSSVSLLHLLWLMCARKKSHAEEMLLSALDTWHPIIFQMGHFILALGSIVIIVTLPKFFYTFRKFEYMFFIRNHFISNLVLDSLKFKKLLELHVFL